MGLSVFLILFVLMGSVSAINDNITDLSQDTDNAIAQEKISTGNDDSSLKEIENNELLKTNPENTTLKTLVGGNTFADIQTAIDSAASGDTLELNGLYKGSGTPVIIDKNNLTIVGNDAILDAQGQSRIFNITGTGIILKNIGFINGNATDKGGAIYWYGVNGAVNDCNFTNNKAAQMGGAIYWYAYNGSISNSNFVNNTAESNGGAIYTAESLTLNNVTFISNYASKNGGAVAVYEDVTINCNSSEFFDNYAGEGGSSIVVGKGKLNLYKSCITSKIYAKAGQIMGSPDAIFYLENITFANITATYSPAIYLVGSKIRIIDSKFINLKANITAGAMSLREGGELYISNCEFINTTSSRNAGAVYVDITGYNPGNEGNVTIIDSKFKDASSEFGGAYVQLGGQFWLNNTEFINNHAAFNGGAIYLSFTETEINNCTFESNGAGIIEDYPTSGGAIFSDISTLNITNSRFFNNVASEGNAILIQH